MKATTFYLESIALLQSVKALAEKVLELLTSTTTILVLGIVAVFAIMAATINGTWSTFHTVSVMSFALVMALSMTVDIEKGGDA
jgi:membrane protein implicated in regulation of membrane protease activity